MIWNNPVLISFDEVLSQENGEILRKWLEKKFESIVDIDAALKSRAIEEVICFVCEWRHTGINNDINCF